MSLRSLPGLVSGSPRSLTIGSDGWRRRHYRSAGLAGPFEHTRHGALTPVTARRLADVPSPLDLISSACIGQ